MQAISRLSVWKIAVYSNVMLRYHGACHIKQQITIAFLVVVLLSACASTLNVLDNVRNGQREKEAMGSVGATPTLIFENQKTKVTTQHTAQKKHKKVQKKLDKVFA
jgi:uncharacterized lipoprotein